jgi:hypothetical protein
MKKKQKQPQQPPAGYVALRPCGCVLARCSGRKSERRHAARFADQYRQNSMVVQQIPPAEVALKRAGCRCRDWPEPQPDAARPAAVPDEIETAGFSADFIGAVQTLEAVTQMQWDDYAWLMQGHSLFAACSLDSPEVNDGLFFGIAGNQTPAWAECLNGWTLDDAGKAAHRRGAINDAQLLSILSYFGLEI